MLEYMFQYQVWLEAKNVVRGFQEFLPKIKRGDIKVNPRLELILKMKLSRKKKDKE